MSKKKARVRLPLTCSMLSQGRRILASKIDGEHMCDVAWSNILFLAQSIRVVGIRRQ